MYSTCLFCNKSLGSNEAIEHFPVGRRLAYDSATGRLWVVCRNCERWNLSPLESRWEAIEEAERAFRGTKMRVLSDNIGLAKLRDDTELVRIGKPPQTELAAWRYGDQFGKRWKKHLWRSSGVAIVASTSISIMAQLSGAAIGGAIVVGAGLNMLGAFGYRSAERKFNEWRDRTVPVASVRNEAGDLLRLTQDNINSATLAPSNSGDSWRLRLPHAITKRSHGLARLIRHSEEAAAVEKPVIIHGAAAIRALSTLLPHANRIGADRDSVKSALGTIEQTQSLAALMEMASIERADQPQRLRGQPLGKKIANAPAHVRLALEMALHADDERRAMAGELAELEQRWRDADAIAKIADELLLPDGINDQLNTLRDRA